MAGTVSVFDTTDSTKLSGDWNSFLNQQEVSCPLTIVTSATDPNKATTARVTSLVSANSPRFWNLTFTTEANNARVGLPDFNVGQSIILGLPKTEANPPPVPPLDDILRAFGLVADANQQFAKGTLIDKLISKIKGQLSLMIDPTETRCALWLTPGLTPRTDTALVFQIDSSKSNIVSDITQIVASELSLDQSKVSIFTNPKIFMQRTCHGIQTFSSATDSTWQVTTAFRLTFRFTLGNFWLWINYVSTGMTFSLTQNLDNDIENASLWNSLNDLGLSAISSSAVTPLLEGLLDPVRLLNLTAGMTFSGTIQWRVALALNLGRPKSGTTAVAAGNAGGPPTGPLEMFFLYDSMTQTFSGGLLLAGFYADANAKLLPTYLPGIDIDAPHGISPTPAWDLRQLSTVFDSLPQGLPTTITEALVSYEKGSPEGTKGKFYLTAKLVLPPSPPDQLVPTPKFTFDELDVELVKSTDIACTASAFFSLQPRSGDPWPAAHLGLSISYDGISSGTDKTWTMIGFADNLSVGLLYSFFDTNYVEPLVSALGGLTIISLDVLFTYASGVASSFCFTGLISLGPVQLRMVYQYASKEAGSQTAASKMSLPADGPQAQPPVTSTPTWRFECDLESTGDNATIGSIVSAISAEEGKLLPPFISNITLTNTQGANNRRLISIEVAKRAAGQIIFMLQIAIESVKLTYIQVAPKDKTMKTKRLLRFAIDKIPLLKNIPLLGELPQPFDQLEYYWVNNAGGLLQSEVDAVNDELQISGGDALMVKETTGPARDKTGKPDTANPPDPVVLVPGHHFVVTKDNEVVIDHVFNASKATTQATTPPSTSSQDGAQTAPPAGNQSTTESGAQPAPTEDVQPSKPSKGALSFSLGPLTISAVTLQYKEKGTDKILSVTMDATFALGPISFSLLGFSIGIPLSGDIQLNKLGHLVSQIVIDLAGMAVSFNKPPLLLAGGFEHNKTATEEIFLGGLGISFPPYTFIGVGEYKILNDYKSVFIYAKLDGPIITLEFATIEGVRLGFGFNSMVRSPTIDEITSFPFINDTGTEGAGNDPMNILKSMIAVPPDNPWVVAKNDSYWFAAGMTVTAFDILKITAVAMFAFRDSGLIISLFADAVAQMPANVTDRSELIVYVEIGLVAEMNFVDGYFRVEAALAPTSFLLVPQCRVYGGFALVYWFAPNDHAGDWVFSIGGYHKNYDKPAWYPEPKRIGISFPIGILSVTGEAYFAITPKVAMGGAMIHVTLGFGPIEAWLDASMDALVNFHPLHLIVDFSISVGVSFNIDVWFIHIHISASVGAWLHIEGPEFGGTAYVDFYLFGFSVDFGASNNPPPPATLLQFWEMLHKPGPGSGSLDTGADPNPVQSLITYRKIDSKGIELKIDDDHQPLPKIETQDGAALKFILEDGNYPMPTKADPTPSATSKPPNGGAGAKWFVRGGSFAFRIASDFALSAGHIDAAADDHEHKPIDVTAPVDPKNPSSSRPMRITAPIESTLTVTIREKDGARNIIAGWTSVGFDIKLVPTALWGPYDQALDPLFTRDPKALLKTGDASAPPTTIPLAMALKVSAPDPELAVSFIPVFKPSMVANFRVLDFRTVTNGTDWIMPPRGSTQTAYLAAPMSAEENGLVAAKSLDTLWEKKQATWKGLATVEMQATVNGVDGILDQVAGIFGWAPNRPQGEDPNLQLWKLTGTVPGKLVDNIKNCYLELPRMATVA